MDPLDLSREQIYLAIWAKPISHLATEWNVKIWDIQKWCRQKDIPLPEQGHWARIRHGKQIVQPPLPPVPEPLEADLGNNSKQVFEPPPVFDGEGELSFVVPDRLMKPDQLITAAEKDLQSDRHRGKMMAETGYDHFPIRVTTANIGRALRIVDTLIKCWRRRGYRIVLQERQAFIYLREIRQRVHLYEVCKSLPKAHEDDRRNLKPTGKLSFRMDWWGGRDWRDGRKPLEDQIKDILDHMELSARQLEREREKPPVKPPGTISQVAITGPTDPNYFSYDFKDLLRNAKRWKQLKLVDEYLAALFVAREHTPEFLEWLTWAKHQRRSADPLDFSKES